MMPTCHMPVTEYFHAHGFMIGYLAYLVKQFIGLGYDGTVKICCINNYSALDYHQKKQPPTVVWGSITYTESYLIAGRRKVVV